MLAKSFSSVGFNGANRGESKLLAFQMHRPSELVMRRPTDLQMPNKPQDLRFDKLPTNSLKRPSSILFESKKPSKPSSDASSNPTNDHSKQTENPTSADYYPFLVNPQKFNKFSNTNTQPAAAATTPKPAFNSLNSQIATVSVCSCSPSSRSSSALSITSSSLVSLSSPTNAAPISFICTSCSTSLTASQKDFSKKKIKLSPVQDRMMNSFQMTQ